MQKQLRNTAISTNEIPFVKTKEKRGWSGGAKVQGTLSVPGRPTNLDDGRARVYRACIRCGWGVVWTFSLVYHFLFLSPSLGDGPI